MAKPPAAFKTVKEYSEVCSTHGIFYVFVRGYGRLSQFVWALICLALITLGVYLIFMAYSNWKNNPVLTSVSTTGLPIGLVDYPAITICGMGMVDTVLENAIREQAIGYVMDHTGMNRSMINENSIDIENLLLDNGASYNEFVKALYPGLEGVDIKEIISIMASSKPDAFLFSKIAAQGGYDPCNDVTTTDTANYDPCGSGEYEVDDTGSYCIRALNSPRLGADIFAAFTNCNSDLGESEFSADDDFELELLEKMLLNDSAKIATLKTKTFWTNKVRDEVTGFFPFNDVQLDPFSTTLSLNKMVIDGSLDDMAKSCFVLQYDETISKFRGRQANCLTEEHSVICVKAPLPYCGPDNSEGGTTWDPEYHAASKLDLLLDPEKYRTTSKGIAQKRRVLRETFQKIKMVQAAPALLEALWYSQLPCFDNSVTMYDPEVVNGKGTESKALLRKCLWKGRAISCASIFKTFPTDRGMCCTFNMEAAEKIFQESSYSHYISLMQNRDRDLVLPKLSAMLPSWFTAASEPMPESGVDKGLTVILDAHSNLISPGSIKEDFQGFIAIVGSSKQYPLTEQRNIRIRPGFDNLVAISATDIRASDSLKKSVTAEKRNCYFEDEHRLEVHSKYSQGNCLLECRMSYAKEVTTVNASNCNPWFLPPDQSQGASMVSMNMCDPWDAENFTRIMRETPYSRCSHCLPDCNSTLYDVRVSTVPFRVCDEKNLGVSFLCDLKSLETPDPPIYRHLLEYEYGNLPYYVKGTSNLREHSANAQYVMFKGLENATYNAYEKDMAIVTFYFDRPSIFQYTRDARMTWTDFLSQIGGLLGLCIGFSLCSGIEIVYWFTIRLWVNIMSGTSSKDKNKNKTKKHKKSKSSRPVTSNTEEVNVKSYWMSNKARY